MTKFFKNLYRLIIIGTPLFIILNYIKNFLPNYKIKKKSNILEKTIYNNFISYNENEKWFESGNSCCSNRRFDCLRLRSKKGQQGGGEENSGRNEDHARIQVLRQEGQAR